MVAVPRIATVLVAGAALGLLALTPASATAGGARTLSFDVVFRPFEENYVDVGSPGTGVGDLLVFHDQLLVEGVPAGVQGGTCTIIAALADDFQTHCVGAVSLAAGQIAFQGLATAHPVKELPVVGGSGMYRDASGRLTLTENGDGTGTVVVELGGRR